MKKIINLLLCFSLIGFPGFSKGSKEETGKLVGGIVGGFAVPAAGAVALSFIPGLGTITGLIGGGVLGFVGSLIGMTGGGAIGESIGQSMYDAYDYAPIFDVRTKIEYSLLPGNNLLLYPELGSDSEITIIGNQLSIEIDMTPARIDNEDNADETNIAIPVIIQITKTSEVNSQITCEYYEGLSNLTKVESDLEGIFYYGQLDTVEKTNNIMFKIESEEGTCSIQFDVFYGASGNKVIVSDDSNASSTFIINFIEREHLGL